jgi:hypothetical protein
VTKTVLEKRIFSILLQVLFYYVIVKSVHSCIFSHLKLLFNGEESDGKDNS